MNSEPPQGTGPQTLDRMLLLHIAIASTLALAGFFLLDRSVAEHLHRSGYEGAWIFSAGTELLDLVTGKEVSKFLPGGIIIFCGAVLSLIANKKQLGRALLFVGAVQLLSTLLTGISKNLFGRMRPYQLIENGEWHNAWFAEGSAFPSGHAGFYFGLFLPLAYLFPRWRWPLLIVPWFIGCARVIANDHFISDVAASIALAGLITLLLARIVKLPMDTSQNESTHLSSIVSGS